MFMDDHHGDGRLALWCAAPAGVQSTMIDEDPELEAMNIKKVAELQQEKQFLTSALEGHRRTLAKYPLSVHDMRTSLTRSTCRYSTPSTVSSSSDRGHHGVRQTAS